MGDDKKLNIGLRLLVQNPGSAEPVLPIGWCVAPKTLETIARRKIKNPHLLISIVSLAPNWRYQDGGVSDDETVYNYREVERKLIPLKQGLEYFDIGKPGKYRIFATIVGDNFSDTNQLRKYYGGGQARNIITENGDFNPPKPNLRRASVDVEVGPEFFAHEPAEWERRWVNMFYSTPAKDQCEFRRRRIFAYSAQVVAMLIFWLAFAALRFVTALLLLIGGYRNISWSPIWHPWIWEFGVDHKVKVSDSVFFTNRKGQARWFLMPAWPYWSLTIVLVGAFLTKHYDWQWLLPVFVSEFLLVFVLGSVILFAIRKCIAKIESVPDEVWEEKVEIREAAALAKAFAKQQADLQYLQCNSMPAVPTVKALPHPSMRLRYLALKAQICRPFSHS